MQDFTDVRDVLHTGIRMFVSVDSNTDIMRAVLKKTSDNEIALSIPVKDDGYFYPLRKGTKVEIYFYKGSGRYYFKSIVTGRVIYNNRPVLKCALPKKMIRTERRQYYRVDIFFPVRIIVEGRQADYRTQCVDISGGGMQLDPAHSLNVPLNIGDSIEIDFCEALPGVSNAKGKVVREPRGKKNGWGIRFTSISDTDRDRIIRYVFKKQLDRKKQLEDAMNAEKRLG